MNRSSLRASGPGGGDHQRQRAPRGRIMRMTALGVLSGAVATAGLMLPAEALVNPPHTVFVLKNSSEVEAEGYVPDEPMRVELRRRGVVVGSFAGPASQTGTLALNHDQCWDNFTPQILPGDVVAVTSNGGATTETVRVANIELTGQPTLVDADTFTITGRANGAVRPALNQLGAFARTETPVRYRPETPDDGTVTYDGAGGAFTATFNMNAAEQTAFPNLTGASVFLAPTANEQTIASGLNGDLPAPGPGCSAVQSHAVTDLSHTVINRTNRSRNLVVSGMTIDATAVNVRLRDGDGTVVNGAANVTGAAGPQTWRATFPAGRLAALNGRITVAGQYTTGGATLNGATMTVNKDLVNPNPPRSSLRPGVYPRRQFVTLDAGPGARIRWTLGKGQAAPTATRGNLYRGQQIAITASQTLKMRAVDQAGNVSPVITKSYIIGRGPSAPRIGQARSGQAGGRDTAVARWRSPSVRAAQVTAYRVTALKLRPNGSVARRVNSDAVRASSRRLAMRLPGGRYQFRVKAIGGPMSARSNVVRSR